MSESDSYKDKLQSLSFSKLRGTTRKRPVTDERTGQYVGYQTDHWSGRVDATITEASVQVSPELKAERA
jgi:hypothetical protein